MSPIIASELHLFFLSNMLRPPRTTLFPYTTLFRSRGGREQPASAHSTRKVASLAVNVCRPTVGYTAPGGVLAPSHVCSFRAGARKRGPASRRVKAALGADTCGAWLHPHSPLRSTRCAAALLHALRVGRRRAFDGHPKLPHMTRFLGLVGELTTHPVKGIRTKQIG